MAQFVTLEEAASLLVLVGSVEMERSTHAWAHVQTLLRVKMADTIYIDAPTACVSIAMNSNVGMELVFRTSETQEHGICLYKDVNKNKNRILYCFVHFKLIKL